MTRSPDHRPASEPLSLTITRTFDAPRELVWAAWTQRDHLIHWFCPKDFVVTFINVDLRVGGRYRSGMRSPEGREYVMSGEYRTIEPPRRLAFSHAWEKEHDMASIETLITVTLDEVEGKTRMTFTHAGFDTVESRDSHHEGWSEALDNLGTHLANSPA